MASNLLVVESPAKAKTLKKYLGRDFEILATFGHVRDLLPKQGAVDPAQDFAMKYAPIERNEKNVAAIAKASNKAKEIFLATDPDREGEAIAWHLLELLKDKKLLKAKSPKRVVFYEITESAVRDAVAHPREISMPLVNAQQARRALDYLVGFNLSPLLWRKIRPGLSAGRVQSPALRLIVEREQEVAAFKPLEYWTIHLDTVKDKQRFSARLIQYQGEKIEQLSVTSETQQQIIADLTPTKKKIATVKSVDKKQKQRNPAPPFTTSTLQQEAVRKLGMSTERAMRTAQQLYEGVDVGSGTVGLITYMRTDSLSLANEAINEIRDYIKKNFDPEYLPKSAIHYKSKAKNVQEAHEAIRPTSVKRTPESLREHLTPEQAKLYEMIWKRALACQLSPAKFDTTSVDLSLNSGRGVFRANGQVLVFPGFISVYQEGADDSDDALEDRLPQLKVGDELPIEKLYGTQHFTQPPPRYTEASLVKTLEEHGIGRPSTYASIISTLLDREYAILDKKRFIPTDVGNVVIKFLTEHFNPYVDYDFTAKLEDQLDFIANGKRKWIPVLKEFWRDFSKLVSEKGNVARPGNEALEETCPNCGKQLVKKFGRRGFFIGCSGYPDCDFTKNPEAGGTESQVPLAKNLGTDPKTSSAIFLLRGPYGYYVQLGDPKKIEGEKPKRVTWPKNIPVESADLETALKLLALPLDLGNHPKTGKKIVANIGRFGPYVSHDGAFKSVPKHENIFDINKKRAMELLAEAKSTLAGRQLGNHPLDNKPVTLRSGRYGAYIKHGKINATVPANVKPEDIDLALAVEVLAAKVEKSLGKKKTKITSRTSTKKPKRSK